MQKFIILKHDNSHKHLDTIISKTENRFFPPQNSECFQMKHFGVLW